MGSANMRRDVDQGDRDLVSEQSQAGEFTGDWVQHGVVTWFVKLVKTASVGLGEAG